jgi:hypothetical protein
MGLSGYTIALHSLPSSLCWQTIIARDYNELKRKGLDVCNRQEAPADSITSVSNQLVRITGSRITYGETDLNMFTKWWPQGQLGSLWLSRVFRSMVSISIRVK